MPPIESTIEALDELIDYAKEHGFTIACVGIPSYRVNLYEYAGYPTVADTEYCAYIYDLGLMPSFHRIYWDTGTIRREKYELDTKKWIDNYFARVMAHKAVGTTRGWAEYQLAVEQRAKQILESMRVYNPALEQEIGKNLEAQPLAWAIHWQYHEEAPQHYDLGITDYTIEYDDNYLFVLSGGRRVFMLERLGLVYVGFRPMGL